MTLKRMADSGQLQPHATSRGELRGLRALVRRDMEDAQVPGLSTDRRFATAYNAGLQISAMVIACAGYRVTTTRGGHHRNAFEAVRHISGLDQKSLIDYLDTCRRKRNRLEYDTPGVVSETEADELLEKVQEFLEVVEDWIRRRHPRFTA